MKPAAFSTSMALVIASTSVAQQWEPQAPMNTPRAHFAAVATRCGDIYAIGGVYTWCGGAEDMDTVERFSEGSWSYVSALPEARSHHAAVVVGRFVYVIGGATPSERPILHRYLPQTTIQTLAAESQTGLSAGGIPRVHGYYCASHITGFIRSQKYSDFGNFIRFGQSTHGNRFIGEILQIFCRWR